jgi:Domain of unknown function (DUF4189)
MKLFSAACVRTAIVSALAGTVLAVAASPANADAYNYGAIAISRQTGSTGYSYNYSSRAAAEAQAISKCGVADCQAVVWFANGCGAAAQATDQSWGWGWGSSLSIAESYALAGTSGNGARIVSWACTSGHR